MAGRPAAGVPSPQSSTVSQLRRGKGGSQWTYPSEEPARGSHAHARQRLVYAGVEHREDVVSSLHPCPWTMRVKEPRICYDGLLGIATTPPQQGAAPSAQARNLEHQWSLDEFGGEADVAALHDTRGPIGHGCDSPAGTPEHARKSTARHILHVDGTYIPQHDSEPKKSVSWATDVQRSSPRIRPGSTARVKRDQKNNAGHSTAWSRASDELAKRQAGWVDSLREDRSKTPGAAGLLEPDVQSEEVTPATGTSSVGVIGHPLFDMLAAAISAASAPAGPEEAPVQSRDGGAEQPWWDDASDDEETKTYPKPWRENMNLRQPKRSAKPEPRTPERNPLAHLQTETDGRDRPSGPTVTDDRTGVPAQEIFIKRAMSMPGGAKLRHKREVIQENSPWRWSAERERQAKHKAEERSDGTVSTHGRSRRSTSPGGSPVCGGAV